MNDSVSPHADLGDREDDYILISSVLDKHKNWNSRYDPRVTLAVADPENRFCYLSVRDEIIEYHAERALENIERVRDDLREKVNLFEECEVALRVRP